MQLDIAIKLKPNFAGLSDESLLEKCFHGETQNQNESFKAMNLDWIPKTRYVSLKLGVHDAFAYMPSHPHLTGDIRNSLLSPAFKIFTRFHPHSP